MERMMERLTISKRNPPRENPPAPKRAYTRSYPNPKPAIATDNPKQLLRKKTIVEGSVRHNPLQKSPSLPEELVAIQDLDFDIFFEQSLFRTKSDSFVAETVLDPTVLQPWTPEVLSPTTKPQTTHFVPASPSSSSSFSTTPPIIQFVIPPPPPIMAARYAPLVLAAPLHVVCQYYKTRLPQFDRTGPLSTQ
jgi:hypothetical protein